MVNELTHLVSIAVKRNLTILGVSKTSNILVGVSGGIDSMVLLVVLHKLGYTVSAAHVNFNLRGSESHNDAVFVKQWCLEQGISHYELSKDTKQYATSNDLNTQTAARNIRYEWWEYLVHTHQFDFVATAHHLDDTIETVFINLLRGTGMKGLRGIPHLRDFYVRPLLESSRIEIESFAATFDIPFRTDGSNLSDDYQRNRLRHHLLPLLEELSPNFHASMKHTLHRVNLEWDCWEHTFRQWSLLHVKQHMDGFLLKATGHEIPFLLRWLEGKGIPWNLSYDFISSTNANSGHLLTYEPYRMSRTQDGYYVEEIQPDMNIVLHQPGSHSFGNFRLTIEIINFEDYIQNDNPWIEYVSVDSIQWPLHIRHVKAGDKFQPLGMQGKTKKIQDLMVDQKLEMFEKERLFLLTNAEHIIWVIGIRLDERARIKSGENRIYRLTFRPEENT